MITAPVTIETLKTSSSWVAWQSEIRKETGKATKVPYSPSGPVTRKAKADAPATWGTWSEAGAKAAQLEKPFGQGGIGLQLCAAGDGRNYGGVDLDTCRDPETGVLDQWAQDIISSIPTYWEISPSKTGVKGFFLYTAKDLPTLREAMNGPQHSKMFKAGTGDHAPGIELHLGNRYFAVTEDALPGSPLEFCHVETRKLINLIKNVGPSYVKSTKSPEHRTEEVSGRSNDRSRSAVAFRKGLMLRRDGATFEQMVEGLLADPETQAWAREKGQACNQREFRRIWERAQPKGPVIRITPGELHNTATEAEQALLQSGKAIFQRGINLIQPIKHDLPASRGRMTVVAGLAKITAPNLIDFMSESAEFHRYDARSKDYKRVDPTQEIAQILLSRHGRWSFPSIAGVVTTPTLRPDGSLLTASGYDQATRLYHVTDDDLKLRSFVHNPTKDVARSALKKLLELLKGFPFVKTSGPDGKELNVSESVALSALITPVVRGALPAGPLHGINATAPGAGKSFLVDCASAIATGRPCPVNSVSKSEQETEKRIVGLLLGGYPLISLDNCNGELASDLLCQAVERPLVRIRRLGGSDIQEIECSVTIYATGNNLRLKGDLVRRSLLCTIDPEMERPEKRTFDSDPVATILADRGLYVSCCLAIVRAYQAAGLPKKLSPIASFAEWSDLVRSALVWLDCADPALSMETAREDDPELSDLREIMGAWDDALGGTATTCRGAIDTANSKYAPADANGDHPTYAAQTEARFPELQDALNRIAGGRGGIESPRLGRWLVSKEGRIVNNQRFKRDGMTGGSVRWKLETLKVG